MVCNKGVSSTRNPLKCMNCGEAISLHSVVVELRTVHNERSQVDHPLHYTAHPSGIECITIVEHMPFNIGNAIKYLWRSGLKENAPTEQDLDKAIWYIQREKERLKK